MTNIWSLHLSFVECKSFFESNSIWDKLVYYLIDFGNFSLKSYLPLTRKHSVTHVHGLSVYVKEGASFYRLISGKIWRFLCFWQALLHSLLYFFFCCQSPSSSLCMIFDASGHSAFIRQHAMKSFPSTCPSNRLSLSFLKIR